MFCCNTKKIPIFKKSLDNLLETYLRLTPFVTSASWSQSLIICHMSFRDSIKEAFETKECFLREAKKWENMRKSAQLSLACSRKSFSLSTRTIMSAHEAFSWYVEGLMTLIAGLIGLYGNSCSLRLFSKQKEHKIFHNLLLLLAIFDLVRLMTNFLPFLALEKTFFFHFSLLF